jgi:hypothetical protein
MPKRRQCLRTGGRLDRTVVVRTQGGAQQAPDRRLVLDDQDLDGVAGQVG